MNFRIKLPPINITGPRPQPEAAAQAVVEKLLPGLARQLEPLLPDAAPAHRVLSLRELDQAGKVTSHAEYPAVPPPAVQAQWLAREMAPAMVQGYAKAIAARYRELDAAQARAAAAARAADQAPGWRRVEAAAWRALKSMDGRTSVPGEPEAPTTTTKGKPR
jgi:hypothetical protein